MGYAGVRAHLCGLQIVMLSLAAPPRPAPPLLLPTRVRRWVLRGAGAPVTMQQFLTVNLIPVTLGNIFAGTVSKGAMAAAVCRLPPGAFHAPPPPPPLVPSSDCDVLHSLVHARCLAWTVAGCRCSWPPPTPCCMAPWARR